MTICRQWTTVKHTNTGHEVRPLKCRSWQCDFCAPERRFQLMALAASGDPNRFITLTVAPTEGTDPRDRLRLLRRAWNVSMKRLRRLHPNQPIEYLAVVEETKNHEPHLHILYRGPYIPQDRLSAYMRELINSPIVDIRKIRNTGEVVRYVAKYISKAPKQFERAKRYWHSKGYELEPPPAGASTLGDGEFWEVIKRPIDLVLWDFACRGFRFTRSDPETIRATPTYLDETIPWITISGNILIRREDLPPP